MIKIKTLFHLACVLSVFVSQAHASSRPGSKVYKLVYEDFYKTDFDYCIRMFNATHEIGCQSSLSGNVGILHQVKDQATLDEFISAEKSEDYAVFVEEKIFNKAVLLKLLDTGKVSGILVYAETEGQEKSFDWSPESKCPVYQPGLYNDTYGKDYQSCSEASKLLNPTGDGMLDMSIPIPVFYISKLHVKEKLFHCMNNHNLDKQYPYCGVQMKSFMNGAVNSKVCMQRTVSDQALAGTSFCSPIGGHNVVGSLKSLKDKKRHDTVLVTSPLDARSFMLYSNAASNADTATGFLTTLAVASALGKSLTKAEKDGLEKNIVFTLVDGEAFDGIGGKQMVNDLESGNFPIQGGKEDEKAVIKIEDIKNVVELRELGLMQSNLYAHYDPVSYGGKTAEINAMLDKLKANSPTSRTVTPQTTDMGIPASTIQTILQSNDIPSLLLTEYDAKYINRHHMSRQDNLRYLLGADFALNATEDEMLVKIKPLADKLGQVAETVAKSVYEMAANTSDPAVIARIKSDKDEVANLIYCFLHNSNCSYFTNFLPSSFILQLPENEPLLRFVSVSFYRQSVHVAILQGLLHGFLGEEVADKNSTDKCEGGGDLTGVSLFYKNNPQTLQLNSSVCLWASVFYASATQSDNDAEGSNSMWTESNWDSDTESIKLRMFMMQSDYSQGMILMSGIIFFLVSSVIIFFLNQNGSILFRNSATL